MRVEKIAVRALIEYVLRSGHLDLRMTSRNRAQEGTKAHGKFQKRQGDTYMSEVYLTHEVPWDDGVLMISGRADGVIHEDDRWMVDEIKSTTRDLDEIDGEDYPIHWAQIKLYGYFICLQEELDEIDLRLTYIEIVDYKAVHFYKTYSREELKAFLDGILDAYKVWYDLNKEWKEKRDLSVESLEFPFDGYRKGQRELAISVFRTIETETNAFLEAPTGIGKTISTLFPTIKSMKRCNLDHIFYLTAKTITAKVAIDTMKILYDRDLSLRTTALTAKDKICFLDESTCYPEACTYAHGHFDRVNDCLLDLLKNEMFYSRETVEKYAEKHHVCPFELSLDLAMFSDLIICDYNYAFDPKVYLRRFFEEEELRNVLLVDEAHNLLSRARGMYSATLNKAKVLKAKNILKKSDKKGAKYLDKLNQKFLEYKKTFEETEIREFPFDMINDVRASSYVLEHWLLNNREAAGYDEVLDLYFDVLHYIRIDELYCDGYRSYFEKFKKNDFKVKMFCIDPRLVLKRWIDQSVTTVFFSATLHPLPYFEKLYGGNDVDRKLKFPSPFPRENKKVLILRNISTKFKERESSIEPIRQVVDGLYKEKEGNYMVFAPSYRYMDQLVEGFEPECHLIVQDRDMDESSRYAYLDNFEERRNLLSFNVLGGLFSEGIDLTGEKLIGAVIVGVGYPQFDFENKMIETYFNETTGEGFNYAYTYPGFTKVMQAVGRVIRTETDKGIILLVDNRYAYAQYRQLMPADWGRNYVSVMDLKDHLSQFWNDN